VKFAECPKVDSKMVIVENREPVRVFLRIRPELADPDKENIDAGELGGSGAKSSSETKECLTTIEGGTTVRVNPMAPFTQSGKSRKGREGTGSTSTNSFDNRMFTFDKVFPAHSTQEEIYRNVSAHVNATVRGYNTTIFAYGSTGSGKTHTMTGNATAPGIIPRAISEIFSIIEATAAREKDVFFYVRMSYVELYNNNFRNLLDFASKERAAALTPSAKGNSDRGTEGTEKDGEEDEATVNTAFSTSSPSYIHPGLNIKSDKIEVRESKSAGIFLAGPNLRLPVTTAHEAFQLINKGNKVRATAATKCNDFSSRSHAILTLHVESKVHISDSDDDMGGEAAASKESEEGRERKPELRLGKMHLVDLAGSERISLSGAEGGTLLETQSINSSLTAIGDVLAALSRNASLAQKQLAAETEGRDKGRGGKAGSGPSSDAVLYPMVPIPYRNSKLTHLLKDSLGGNSKTIMIATVRNFADHYQQTIVSLMYASRAKKVKNRSSVNRNVMGDTGIQTVNTEIERLRSRLDERSLEFDRLRSMHLQDVQEKTELKSRLSQLSAMNEAERTELEAKMSTIIHSQAGQISTQRQKISVLQKGLSGELAVTKQTVVQKDEEIRWLKEALDKSNRVADNAVNPEEVAHLKRASEEWRTQATGLAEDLAVFKKENDYLRRQNNCYAEEVGKMLESKSKILDAILARRKDGERLEKALECTELERARASEEGHQIKAELEEVASRYKALSEVVVEQEQQLGRQGGALDSLEVSMRQVVASKDEQMASLKAQKDTLSADNRRLEEECGALKGKVESTLAALQEGAMVAVEDSAKKLAASSAQLEQERSHLSEVKKQVSSLTAALDKSNADRLEATKRAEQATAALKTSASELEAARGREGDSQSMSASFSDYLESCVAKMNAMHEKHSSMQGEMEEEMRKLRARIAEHEEGDGGPAVQRLRALYEERERNHKEHHHQQLQRVHDYLGQVEENLREKLGETLLRTNRTLAGKQLEYFAVILARIQKRHKAKLAAALEDKAASEEACAAKERQQERMSADLEAAVADKADLERSLKRELAQAQARYQEDLEALATRSDVRLEEGLRRQAVELSQRHRDDVDVVVRGHAEELAELCKSKDALLEQQERGRQEQAEEVRRLAEALADAEGRLSERASEGTEEREKLQEQHSLQLQELEERHAVAQAQSEARLSELSSQMLSLEKGHEAAIRRHEEQLKDLRAAHDVETEAMQSRHSSELDTALSRQKTLLAEQHASALVALKEDHAAAIAEKQTAISGLTTQFEKAGEEFRRRESELSSLAERAKEDSKAELSHWVGTYTAQLDDLETKGKIEQEAALARQRESLARDHSAAQEALEKAHAAALKEEEERLAAAQDLNERHEGHIADLLAAIASQKDTAAASQSDLQTRLNEALEEQVQAERKITSLSEAVSKHLQEASSLADTVERERTKSKDMGIKHSSELTRLQEKIKAELDQAREGYRQQLSALESGSANDLRSALEAQKASLEGAHDAVVAQLREESSALRTARDEAVVSAEQLSQKCESLERQAATLEQTLEGVRGAHRAEQASRQAADAEASRSAEELQGLEAELRVAKEALAAAEAQREALAREHEVAVGAAAAAQDQAVLRAERAEAEAVAARELSSDRTEKLVSTVAKAEEDLRASACAHEAAMAEKAELEERVQERTAELEAMRAHARASETSLQEMVSSLEREVRLKTEASDKHLAVAEELREREGALQQLVADLQKKAGLSRTESQDRADELSALLEGEKKRYVQLSAQVQAMQAALTKETLRGDSLQSVLTATNEGHMSERIELTERLDQANRRCTALEARLDGTRDSHNQQVRALQTAVRELEADKGDLDAELRRLRDSHREKDSQLSLLTSGSEASLSELREQLQLQQAESLARIQAQHKQQIERALESHSSAASASAAKIEELSTRLTEQERAHAEALYSVENSHAAREQQLAEDSREAQTELTRKIAGLEKDLSGERQRYERETQHLRAAHDAETEAMQSQHSSELDTALSRQKTLLTEQHRLALAAKEDSLSAQQEQSVSTALARQEVRVTELTGINRKLESQKSQLLQEMSSLHANYKGQVDAAAVAQDAAVRDLKKQLLSRDEACRAMEVRVRELEQAMQAEAGASAEEVRALKKQVELERDERDSREKEEREKLQEQHSLQLQELEERHAVAQAQSEARLSELSLLVGRSHEEADTLQQRLQAEEAGRSAQSQQALEERDALERRISDLQTELGKAQTDTEAVRAELASERAEAAAAVAEAEARQRDSERDRLTSVQASEQQLAAVTARLSAAEARHNDQISENAERHELEVRGLREELGRMETMAEQQRGEFESSLVSMEQEYQTQASIARNEQERELAGLERKLSRVEWQYEVTTKCLASMTDRRRLLTEAFEAAGVGEEGRQVVLRDSGCEHDPVSLPPVPPPDTLPSSASRTVKFSISEQDFAGGDSGGVEGSTYPHFNGYSPYGGGAGAATPFKSGSASSSSMSAGEVGMGPATTEGEGSVTDRFIAAILDGDVQGMQAVVRSQGEDLRASYWRGAAHAVQPLHRAISGLQYHGNDQLLLGMLKALVKMGADVNAVDRVGNTPLHKAVLVCTSKNVVNVVSALLVKGADPNQVNNAGDAPLHMECRRARLASVYVVGALLNAGASPSLKCTVSGAIDGSQGDTRARVSPLSMVLLGGLRELDSHANNSSPDHWVLAAHVLVTACPHEAWEPSWVEDGTQRSQLHLLATLFPKATPSAGPYKSLLLHALKHGGFFGTGGGASNVGVSQRGVALTMCKLLARDSNGSEALFILARRMAEVPVVPVSIHAQTVRVGFPSDLLRAICQYIFVDGPEASNSNRAAQELVFALVKCVERAVNSIGKEHVDSSSCLASMIGFVSEHGLATEHRHTSSNGGHRERKSVQAANTRALHADNENYQNY
jgi:hypothetical protein